MQSINDVSKASPKYSYYYRNTLTVLESNFRSYSSNSDNITKVRLRYDSSYTYVDFYFASTSETYGNYYSVTYTPIAATNISSNANVNVEVITTYAPATSSDTYTLVERSLISPNSAAGVYYHLSAENHKRDIHFYHSNDSKYLLFKIGSLYNVARMLTIDIYGNTYVKKIPLQIRLCCYTYNSTIVNPYLQISSNNYQIADSISIVKFANDGMLGILIDFSKWLFTDRIYFSGICSIYSSGEIMYQDTAAFLIDDDTALNGYIDTTWGNQGIFNSFTKIYTPIGDTTPCYQFSGTSFTDIVSNTTTQALDALDVSQLQNMQFLDVGTYSGIFMKHQGNNNIWTFVVFDAYVRERIIQRYSYDSTSSRKYSICTFSV